MQPELGITEILRDTPDYVQRTELDFFFTVNNIFSRQR